MSNKPALIFEVRLGGLFPANRVAEEAMTEIVGRVRVQITGGKANERRRSLYWRLIDLVTPLLNERYNMTLTEADLHDILRDKLRMYDEVRLPSGEVHRKRWSTSNRAMSEHDRAVYLDKCLAIWSRWLDLDVMTLRSEAENIS